MEKEPCTKFCGDLVRFHKVIKIQKSEFSVNDVIPPNIQKITPMVFFAFFNYLYGEEAFSKVLWCF